LNYQNTLHRLHPPQKEQTQPVLSLKTNNINCHPPTKHINMAKAADSHSGHDQHPINCQVVGEVSKIEGG